MEPWQAEESGVDVIDRDDYRKTFLYAVRRLGKAMRHLFMTVRRNGK